MVKSRGKVEMLSNTQWIGVMATLSVALLATVTQIMLSRFKKRAEHELEQVRADLQRLQESERLRRQYFTPLLKTSEELYNKLNDFVANSERSLPLLCGYREKINSLKSIKEVICTPPATYLTSILYQFAKFWACIEAIKRDFGIMELSSGDESRAFYCRIRQTAAVFSSGRLHHGIRINESDILRFEGRILGGAQVLIGESILSKDRNGSECLFYYEFCRRLVTDEEFKNGFSPLINFLEDLKICAIDDKNTEFDFRWAKVVIFGFFLRGLVEELDSANIVSLLPEFQKYESIFLENSKILKENINYFREAYPDP